MQRSARNTCSLVIHGRRARPLNLAFGCINSEPAKTKDEELPGKDVRSIGSLADFLKAGRLGGVRVGSSRHHVRASFGEPEAWVLSDEPRATLPADESRWWRYGIIQVWFDGDVVKALTIAWSLPRYTLPVGFRIDGLPSAPPVWDDFHAYLQRERITDELERQPMGTSSWVQMTLPSGVTLVAGRELISVSVSRTD